MDFSYYLDNLIKKRGYSYRKLGNLSGVNHTYISKICNGTSGVPSPEILRKLSAPLCIPYEELLKAAGYLLNENQTSYSTGPADDILLRVAALSPEGKERLTEFVDFVEHWEKTQKKKKRSKRKQEAATTE
ncbi:MAG: helix-turn-helix domain-containing protein [Bacillota bacterium]